MEPGTTEKMQPLHLYVCSGPAKHRLARKTKLNPADCSRCDPPTNFTFVQSVNPEPGESETRHLIRVLAMARNKK